MFYKLFRILLIAALILTGCLYCFAQSDDARPSIFKTPGETDKDDGPHGIKETFVKMRIEKEKKEHDQMVERGEEVLKIAEKLEKAYAQKGRLTDEEKTQLADVERLGKKIRSDLGGSDDGEDIDNNEDEPAQTKPLSPADAIKFLRSTTANLFDELKTSTRFTISAAAIQSSNAVIRLARFLRISH